MIKRTFNTPIRAITIILAISCLAFYIPLALATVPINFPPTADPNGPYSGVVGQPVQFDGSGSVDPEGGSMSFDWDFGDGNFGTGILPTHTYAAAGQYTIYLTVTDDGGLTDTQQTTADIGEPVGVPEFGAIYIVLILGAAIFAVLNRIGKLQLVPTK